jgi:hypothetical protein
MGRDRARDNRHRRPRETPRRVQRRTPACGCALGAHRDRPRHAPARFRDVVAQLAAPMHGMAKDDPTQTRRAGNAPLWIEQVPFRALDVACGCRKHASEQAPARWLGGANVVQEYPAFAGTTSRPGLRILACARAHSRCDRAHGKLGLRRGRWRSWSGLSCGCGARGCFWRWFLGDGSGSLEPGRRLGVFDGI